MTFAPMALLLTLACFVATWFPLCSSSNAEGPVVREAVTHSTPGRVPSYEEHDSSPQNKGRIGLSPLPFHPQQSDKRTDAAGVIRPGYPDLRGLVKKVNRSVVSIRMLDSSSSWSLWSFGMTGDESNGKALGYGAGFVISDSGHVVTNEHVLRNGTRIEVELLEGRKFFARVIRKDHKNDLALLKIDAPKELLQPVEMGNSDDVELGEWVVGIGNPYGIGQSLMIGIVSTKMRKIPGSGYPPLIQIDAAMNLGNSGGPLFNMEGKVVGINTILLWKSQGIGFATPINVAKELVGIKGRPVASNSFSETSGQFRPAQDVPRPAGENFNPLAPPWKYGR